MNEKDEEIVLDHSYDGIQELDNPLPGWWVTLFFLTVVFGVLYFLYYSFGYGNSIEEKFQADMADHIGETVAENESGSTVIFEKSDGVITQGKTIYASKCSACHGKHAEGVVGPNLTDPVWLNGNGTDNDIYTVITDGVPAKGMIAWKALLSNEERAALTVYIQSIQGSND
jgi:cytochrome c oxidase cbb3-type subunit III